MPHKKAPQRVPEHSEPTAGAKPPGPVCRDAAESTTRGLPSIQKADMLRALACLAGCAAPPDNALSRRLNQTLSYLLTGRSEKEIGTALHLKTGTVHVYVKALYRQFDVSSRAELMALFIRPGPAAVLWRELGRAREQENVPSTAPAWRMDSRP